MSTDPLSFLEEAPASTPAPEAEPTAEAAPVETTAPETPPAEASPGPVRDEKGRFVPKAAAESPTPAPQPAADATPAQPAPAAQPDPMAALTARLDQLERENAGLKSAVTAKRQEAREKRPAPAYFTEEDHAYISEIETQAQQQAFDRIAQASFNRFAKANGEDVAKRVAEWTARQSGLDRAFNDQIIGSDDPFETAFEAWQQDPAQQIEALRAEIAALKGGASPNPATPATPNPAPASPPAPRTIANATSAGGAAHVPSGPGQGYASVFSG